MDLDTLINQYNSGLITAIEFRDAFILFLMELNESELAMVFETVFADERTKQ